MVNKKAPTKITVDGVLMTILWSLTRLSMLWIWLNRTRFVEADVHYYFNQTAEAISTNTPGLVEYPPPIAWLMRLIYALSGGDFTAFETIFVFFILLLDVTVTVVLWRKDSWQSAIYWTLFVFLLGPIVWFRIDMLPAAAIVFALVLFKSQSRLGQFGSGLAIAIGAATKLWPALLLSGLLGKSKNAVQRLKGFLVVGLGLGLSSLLIAGWSGSTSALTWQSDRGLQIESIAATPAMADRAFGNADKYQVNISIYNAWEISWRNDSIPLLFSSLALAAAVCFAIYATVQLIHTDRSLEGTALHTKTVILTFLALILAVIITNKTLSPQYIVWLGGPLAMLTRLPKGKGGSKALFHIGIMGFFVAAGTQLVYPITYAQLLITPPDKIATLILVFRNALLVLMTVVAVYLASKRLNSLKKEANTVATNYL